MEVYILSNTISIIEKNMPTGKVYEDNNSTLYKISSALLIIIRKLSKLWDILGQYQKVIPATECITCSLLYPAG